MRTEKRNLVQRIENHGVNTKISRGISKEFRQKLRMNLDFKIILGCTLIVAALISAYLISQSTSRMVTVWSAIRDLGPGEIIEESDIAATKVALNNRADLYLNSRNSILGSYVLREIRSFELIPSFAISSTAPKNSRRVSIAVDEVHLATGVSSGSIIDLYGINKSDVSIEVQGAEALRSQLLLSNVVIDDINRAANKMGGQFGLTLVVPENDVARLIEAISRYEFVVVRQI